MRLVIYRGKWCVYTGRGRRISLHTTDRALAEQRFADLKAQAARKIITVGEIVDAYIEDRKAIPSHPIMKFQWKNAKKHFENLLPEHITRDVCRAYIDQRKGPVKDDGAEDNAPANETIRKEIGIVRAAVRWKFPNSSAVFELPPTSPPRENYLSREQYKTLLASCKLHHLKLFVMLAIATAGRKTAILELTWDRVDFERGLISLGKGEKTAKGRATVPMTENLRLALKDAEKVAMSSYVVEYAGAAVGKIDKGFREAAKRAKVDVTPHDLRRSAAIWMAEARVPMSEIAAYLGHSDSRITERVYAKFSPTYLKEASKALEI